MLTDAQISQFKTEGWTSAADFFNQEEIAALKADLNRLHDVGKFYNVATDGDGETESNKKANMQLCPLSPHSRLLRSLPFASKVKEAVGSLIGDPFALHLDQVFCKPARKGMGTNWHQDNAYFQIKNPFMGTAMWIAVDEATKANGTIRVVPGEAANELEHSRDPMSNHHIRCYPDETKEIHVELPAGGVAFHFLNQACIDEPVQKNGITYGVKITGPDASNGYMEYGENLEGVFEAMSQQTVTV